MTARLNTVGQSVSHDHLICMDVVVFRSTLVIACQEHFTFLMGECVLVLSTRLQIFAYICLESCIYKSMFK